jgi:uncharacterized membrane protein YagU involved in acid resistance
MIAGLVATVVLSALMLMKSMMGLMPGLDVVAMLAGMAHGMMGLPANPVVGWVLHFMIGTVLWGIGFALLYKVLPSGGPVSKGIVFGVLAWLLMMLIAMPMAGAGLFGMKMGMMAPVMTLVLHLIWGAVLGATYSGLGRSSANA